MIDPLRILKGSLFPCFAIHFSRAYKDFFHFKSLIRVGPAHYRVGVSHYLLCFVPLASSVTCVIVAAFGLRKYTLSCCNIIANEVYS